MQQDDQIEERVVQASGAFPTSAKPVFMGFILIAAVVVGLCLTVYVLNEDTPFDRKERSSTVDEELDVGPPI